MTSARDSDDGIMQRGARLRQQKDVLSLNTCKSDGGARAIEHWRAQAHIGLAARYIARPGRRSGRLVSKATTLERRPLCVDDRQMSEASTLFVQCMYDRQGVKG